MHRAALSFVDAITAEGGSIGMEPDGGFDVHTDDDALFARLTAFLGPDVPGAITAPRRALRDVLQARDRAARELLALPVALAPLPKGSVPYTACFERCTVDVGGRKLVDGLITTSKAVYDRESARRPVFIARELVTAALAVELGRAGALDFDRWLASKRRGPWTLLPELAGLPPLKRGGTPRPPTLTIGELFDELGAVLVSCELHEPQSAASEAA